MNAFRIKYRVATSRGRVQHKQSAVYVTRDFATYGEREMFFIHELWLLEHPPIDGTPVILQHVESVCPTRHSPGLFADRTEVAHTECAYRFWTAEDGVDQFECIDKDELHHLAPGLPGMTAIKRWLQTPRVAMA